LHQTSSNAPARWKDLWKTFEDALEGRGTRFAEVCGVTSNSAIEELLRYLGFQEEYELSTLIKEFKKRQKKGKF
jgi:hypothetical protein